MNHELDSRTVIEKYYKLRSCRATGEALGCSGEHIRRILLREGINLTGWKTKKAPPKVYRFKRTTESEAAVIGMYQDGAEIKTICDTLRVSVTTMYKILDAYDISRERVPQYEEVSAEELTNYYTDGHSVKETAEHFGITKGRVNNAVKRLRISNGKKWQEGSKAENRKRSIEAEQRYAQTLDGLGFIYLGGYKNKKSTLEMQCKQCGCTFKRSIDYINDERFECPECKRIREAPILEAQRQERERLKAQQEEERNRQKEEQKLIREQEKQRAEAENAEALFHMLNDKNHVCTVCGKRFSKAEFMKDKGRTLIPTNPKYCSRVCERKHNNKLKYARDRENGYKAGNHWHRAKKYGVPYESGITLAKLIKRDGLRCALCGGMCNPNDHSYSEYAGATYPSIDHIIPMSKGGGHTWDNVQVAHMICNALKGNSLEATG